MRYRYIVAEVPELDRERRRPSAGDLASGDMEQLDFDPTLTRGSIDALVARAGGRLWGAWYGGTFGLATNAMIFVVGSATDALDQALLERALEESHDLRVTETSVFAPMVRADPFQPLSYDNGVVIFRWVHLRPENAERYAALVRKTWPGFEKGRDLKSLALFKETKASPDRQRLMLVTWYANFTVWEQSRVIADNERPYWAERATMELSHFGIAARFII